MGRLIALLYLIFVSSAACADAAAFADELIGIPLLAWAVAALIALVGGVTRIISQRSRVPPAIEISPGPIAWALWVSLIGGCIGFFGGLGVDASPPFVAILVFAGAVAGTAAIDAIKDRLIAFLSAPTSRG